MFKGIYCQKEKKIIKYFSPSYWLKLWVLSAPLFNDKTQGINAKSIDNQSDKNWFIKNTTDLSLIENQEATLTKNQPYNLSHQVTNQTIDPFYQTYLDSISNQEATLTKNQPYNLSHQVTNQTIDPFYQTYLDSISNQELEISTQKHRHEKSINRHKRGVNGENEIEYGGSWRGQFFCSFTPEFWEKIVELKFNNNKENFSQKFADKMYTGVWKDWRVDSHETMKLLGNSFYENFWAIANKFIDSSRRERIRIVFNTEPQFAGSGGNPKIISSNLESVNIRTYDSNYYPNKYLDNLMRALNGENIGDGTVNLGVVNDLSSDTTIEYDIKQKLKERYPNLDFSKISIVDKTDYSYFTASYSCKIYVDAKTSQYSFGNIKTKFYYTTRRKLNEMSNIIANDWKVKQWLKHITEWYSSLPSALSNTRTFSSQQLYNWKRQEKEVIKSYIRDWSYVSTLIEHEFKLDELNKNVQGIKSSFEALKNQINELENRVTNLENTSNANCANIATIGAGSVSVIPVIGTVAGAVATITSGSCAIAGV